MAKTPEAVAQAYGGDKQRIAQAAQMGVLDPTMALMAGMFIDRMRSGQGQAPASGTTVMQDVFQGQAPQGQQAPPQQAQAQAPQQSFSRGGIASLYFAEGGPVYDFNTYITNGLNKIGAGYKINSGYRSAAKNAKVDGVPDSYHKIGAAFDVTPPPGVTASAYAKQLRDEIGGNFDIIPNDKRNYLHIEPGPELGKRVRAGEKIDYAGLAAIKPKQKATATPTTPPPPIIAFDNSVDTPSTLEDNLKRLAGVAGIKTTYGDQAAAQYQQALDPEALKKQKQQDMWLALAQAGFSSAASGSPNFLQSLAQTGASAVGNYADRTKSREQKQKEAMAGLVALENARNAEQTRLALAATDLTTGHRDAVTKNKQFGESLAVTKDVNAARTEIDKGTLGVQKGQLELDNKKLTAMLGNNEDAIQQAMSALSTDKMYNTPTTTREQKAGRLVELVKERGGTITIQQALTRLQTPAAGQQTYPGVSDKEATPTIPLDPKDVAANVKAKQREEAFRQGFNKSPLQYHPYFMGTPPIQ
jgi:hypothetical protein